MDQQELLGINLNTKEQGRFHHLEKEELLHRIEIMNKELMKLQRKNNKLQKSLDMLAQKDFSVEEEVKIPEVSSNLPAQIVPISTSYDAKYESKNPDVKNISIDPKWTADHVYTDDTMDVYEDQNCNCSQCFTASSEIINKQQIITRKLILTRQKEFTFSCTTCTKPIKRKMIEKHVEAEMFFK